MDERILTRDEFLRLLMLKSATLDQRVYRGELPFAFGLSRPAHVGEYLPLDALNVLAGSMLSGCAKIELKTAADLMHDNWEGWLKGVAKVERQMNQAAPSEAYTFPFPPPGPCIFFAVATAFNDDGTVRKVLGAVGTAQETSAATERPKLSGPHGSLYMMPAYIILRTLRNNARTAKVELPKFLIPAPPDTPEFETWLAWARDFRRRAGLKEKAKAKKRAKEIA